MKSCNKITMSLVMLLLGSITGQAQDIFNPESPKEPGLPTTYSRIVLRQNIQDAGSVSGEGRFVVGSNVNVYAYTNSGYSFLNWTNTSGKVVSTNRSFTFTKAEKNDTLTANFVFAPSNPSEPSEPSLQLHYKLGLVPTTGLSVSGAGRYQANKSVYVSCYVEQGYTFLGWFNQAGEKVSSSQGFSYTMPVGGDVLTARCVFNPSVPAEPGDPILKHRVSVSTSEGGYWGGNSGRILEGQSFSLYASSNDGYVFKGWYLNGELYTKLSSFSYTMGKENVDFHARFEFNPSSPSEPYMPETTTNPDGTTKFVYSFYLKSVNGVPGSTINYPIMFVNEKEIGDILIRLTFPEDFIPDPNTAVLGKSSKGYTLSISEAMDNISIVEEGSKLWDFSFVGGETSAGTDALLTFKIPIPQSETTGRKNQVKINQIRLVQQDGRNVTAHTRNGQIGVYKMGDANGDDLVNVLDILSTVNIINNVADESLIPEVANTNNDDETNVQDVIGIVEIIKEETE